MTKKRAQNEKFYSIFFKKSREWKGHEPRCPDRIRTPEKPLAGHTARPAFPASGKPRFFTGCTSISSPCLSPFFRRTPTPENCGFVLCTKCGPCHTARKQFSKGLRSKTGVQQHPKNTQKRLFRQAAAPSEREPFRFALARQPSSTTAYDRLATTFKTFSTGPWDASGVTAIANASITGQPTFSAGWSFI